MSNERKIYFPTSPLQIIDVPAKGNHVGPLRDVGSISEIVIHATGGFNSLVWLSTSTKTDVSIHRLISKPGIIYKILGDDRVAHHVGFSRMGNRENLNPTSLGIELENWNDGKDPYPMTQVISCVLQTREWWGKYGALPIFGHGEVDTQGKTDPFGFDWSQYWSLLFSYLGVEGGESDLSRLRPEVARAFTLSTELQGVISTLKTRVG